MHHIETIIHIVNQVVLHWAWNIQLILWYILKGTLLKINHEEHAVYQIIPKITECTV